MELVKDLHQTGSRAAMSRDIRFKTNTYIKGIALVRNEM